MYRSPTNYIEWQNAAAGLRSYVKIARSGEFSELIGQITGPEKITSIISNRILLHYDFTLEILIKGFLLEKGNPKLLLTYQIYQTSIYRANDEIP